MSYDAETGLFTRKGDGNRHVGKLAGCVTPKGYVTIYLDGRIYSAHRMAWLLVHGDCPEGEIDHIDGNRANNRASNLRLASRFANMQNVAAHKDSSTGLLGVSWHEPTQRYRAKIMANRKQFFLGNFKTAEEASAAYLAAKAKLHEFQPAPRA